MRSLGMEYELSDNHTTSGANINEQACITAYASMTVLGLLFNIIAITILTCGKNFGKSIKLQLLNLAVADIIGAALTPTFVLTTRCVAQTYLGNSAVCKVHLYIMFTAMYLSILINATIAVERFVAVFFPFTMLAYRKKQRLIVIFVTWTVAFIFDIDIIINSGVQPSFYRNDITVCVIKKTESYELSVIFWRIKFLLPIVTIILMYILIFIKLKRLQSIGETDARRKIDRKVCNRFLSYMMMNLSIAGSKI